MGGVTGVARPDPLASRRSFSAKTEEWGAKSWPARGGFLVLGFGCNRRPPVSKEESASRDPGAGDQKAAGAAGLLGGEEEGDSSAVRASTAFVRLGPNRRSLTVVQHQPGRSPVDICLVVSGLWRG